MVLLLVYLVLVPWRGEQQLHLDQLLDTTGIEEPLRGNIQVEYFLDLWHGERFTVYGLR